MVLLVTEKNVLQQRTLGRQESASDLEGFGMPVLGLYLSFFFYLWLEILASGMQQEAHLCGHAKVADCQNAELLEKRVSRELYLVASCGKEVSLH